VIGEAHLLEDQVEHLQRQDSKAHVLRVALEVAGVGCRGSEVDGEIKGSDNLLFGGLIVIFKFKVSNLSECSLLPAHDGEPLLLHLIPVVLDAQVLENEVHTVKQNGQAISFQEPLQVLISEITCDRQRDMDHLEKREVAVLILFFFNELEPVGDRLEGVDLRVVVVVEDAHRHQHYLLLAWVAACHESNFEFLPEAGRLIDGHGEPGSLELGRTVQVNEFGQVVLADQVVGGEALVCDLELSIVPFEVLLATVDFLLPVEFVVRQHQDLL